MLELNTTKADLMILAKNVAEDKEYVWFIAKSSDFTDFSGILKDKRDELYFVQGKMRSGILTINAHRMFARGKYTIKQDSEMIYEFSGMSEDILNETYSIGGNVRGKENGKEWGPEIRELIKR